MARQLRPYLPGVPFHVTARTQGGQSWFDEAMRGFICECIATVQKRSDAALLAFVVMPNHIHLVLHQGSQPLGRYMQPLLTRIAMAVRKKYDLVGHVFGRRYWSHACVTRDYLETCLSYVHYNPVKSQACALPAEYEWSSAACYVNGATPPFGIAVQPALHAHATSVFDVLASPNQCCELLRPRLSMEQVVTHALRELDFDVDIDLLRCMRGRVASAIRRVCIRRAIEAGYRNSQISRFLCISDSTVSKIAVGVRKNEILAGQAG